MVIGSYSQSFGHFATSPQKVTEKHHQRTEDDLRLREGRNDQAKAAPARVQASQKRKRAHLLGVSFVPPQKKTDPPGN